MPDATAQLFHLVHMVDITHDARYDAVSRSFSPRPQLAPATFAVTWPDGTPCSLVEIYLMQLWLTRVATVREDGGTLRAEVSKLTHLIRYCWRAKKDFWELEDADIKQLVDELREERRPSAPQKHIRNANTVRAIVAGAVRFLSWLQRHVILEPKFIGVGPDYHVQLTKRIVPDYRGSMRERLLFHYLPARVTRQPKRPLSREARDRLWRAVNEVSLIDFIPPRWSRMFSEAADLEEALRYLKKRRELLLELLEATGARPGELARMRVSLNEKCYTRQKIVIPTLKRRAEIDREINLPPGVAMRLEVFISQFRHQLLTRLSTHGVTASGDDRVFLGLEGRTWSERSMESDFTRLVKAAGITDYQTCMSMFRHRFITIQVAMHLQAFMEDRNLPRSMITDADYRTILKRVATITGHGSEQSLFHYIDFAWRELGVFDRVDVASALESIIERAQTTVISLMGDVEHGRRRNGRDMLVTVRDVLANLHKEMRSALDAFLTLSSRKRSLSAEDQAAATAE